MYRVEFTNSQSHFDIDEGFFTEVVTRTLEKEGVASAEIGLLIVDNPAIRELNREHLGHDYDTDVLSFPLELQPASAPDEVGAATYLRGAGKHIEGEVVASAEMALNRAADFGWRPEDELTLYVVHGLLHLAGYDDIDNAECVLMRQREREILAHWNLTPAHADA